MSTSSKSSLQADKERTASADSTAATAEREKSPWPRGTPDSSNGSQRQFTHRLINEKSSDDAVVDFEGPDDEYKALNWSGRKKVITTVAYGIMTSCTTWSTSIYASAIPDIAKEFGVSEVVATLGTSLFLFGLGLGTLLWAPISEVYGRKAAVIPPFFVGAIFSFGTATAKDLQTIMITRFFGGFFSAAPLVNTGGVLADIYTPKQRAAAMAGYQMSVVGGPLVAPIIGGAIVDSTISWRWTEYITGILMLSVLALNIFIIDESYGNVLLVSKARQLRLKSGNWALHAKHEEWDVTLKQLANKYLVRPFQLLVTPICFAMCVYSGFVYAIIYLCFTAFPIVYQEERGWNALVGSLPFMGVLIGCGIGAIINIALNKFYLKKLAANNNKPVPEARLIPMMIGGILLTIGLFIFAWTSPKDIHWIGSVIGTVFFGAAFIAIFQGAMNYLVDTFQMYSASAVAANTVVRSLLAGGFPLFTDAMYHNLGVTWASSTLGFISIAMIPIPFLFYMFGRRIRAKGQWSRPSTE